MTDPTTHGAPLAPGPGSANVLIGYMPAWRAIMDQHACPLVSITGPDGVGAVMVGSPTVLINNMMACRMGDIVLEKPGLAMGPANPIIMGCPTVMIGEVGMGAAGGPSPGAALVALSQCMTGPSGQVASVLAKAAQRGSPTAPIPSAVDLTGAGVIGGGTSGSGADDSTTNTWVEIQLHDTQGAPMPNEAYHIDLPDGTSVDGTTDSSGMARLDGIDPGNCQISFPNIDKRSWKKK
jgi:uncharacterized Zn-binding protein involved in type VI secretion